MERVQLNLERFLPELRDLEKKKVFTKSEISEIVKRRTAYETALIRKGSNANDWLAYIEYEKKLERLRRLRCSRMKLKGRPTVSDYSIPRHILTLYSSAVTRLPGSITLWQSYITHVLRTSNSSPEVSRVLARALTLHPTNAAIWLLAIRFEADGTASYAREREKEAEQQEDGGGGPAAVDDEEGVLTDRGIGGGNMDAARKLAMRGIRFAKGATQRDARMLWVEWVRLEISFVERMRKRWEVLGIKDAMAGKPNLQAEDMMDLDGNTSSANDTSAAAPPVVQDKVEQADRQVKSAQESKGRNAVLDGVIVKVVLENALDAFPTDGDGVSIHEDLLNLIRPLPTPLRQDLLDQIYASLRSRIATTEVNATSSSSFENDDNYKAIEQAARCRSILARRHVDDLGELQKDRTVFKPAQVDSVRWIEAVGASVKEFQEAIKAMPNESSVRLLESFADFASEMSDRTRDDGLRAYLSASLAKALKKAAKTNHLSDKLQAIYASSQTSKQ